MLTDFGKLCRKLRIDNDQVLYDMAEVLGVAPSFLSAVENGKKNVPNGWCETIRERYHLNGTEYGMLVEARDNSKIQVKIDLSKSEGEDRNLAFSFARSFESLSSDQKNKILKILHE